METLEKELIFYQAIVEEQSELVCRWLPDTTLTFVNRSYCKFLGKKREDLLGRRWHEFVPGAEKPVVNRYYDMAIQNSKAVHYTHQVCGADGHKHWIYWVDMPIVDNEGVLIEWQSAGWDVTNLEKCKRRIEQYQKKLKAYATKSILVQEQERRRIGKGLHDHVGHNLLLVKNMLANLVNDHPELCMPPLVFSLLDEAVIQIRTLSFELSNPILDEFGLEAAVRYFLAEHIQKCTAITCEFTEEGQPVEWEHNAAILMYGVMRELLINIIKHAQAQHLTVDINRRDNDVEIVVEDDGKGFDCEDVLGSLTESKAVNQGYGLILTNDRIAQLGGSMSISSKQPQGARIVITLPFFCGQTRTISVEEQSL